MPKPSRLTLARDQVLSHFARCPQKVFSEAELTGLLIEHRDTWKLAQSTTHIDFISFLTKNGNLQAHKFRSENYGRLITRYSWGGASPLELAQSISRRGYFCHATAVMLHKLIKIPIRLAQVLLVTSL